MQLFGKVLLDGEQHLGQEGGPMVTTTTNLCERMLEAATCTRPTSYWVRYPELDPVGGLLNVGCQYLDVGLAGTERQTFDAHGVRILRKEVQLGGAGTTKMSSEECLRRGRAFI